MKINHYAAYRSQLSLETNSSKESPSSLDMLQVTKGKYNKVFVDSQLTSALDNLGRVLKTKFVPSHSLSATRVFQLLSHPLEASETMKNLRQNVLEVTIGENNLIAKNSKQEDVIRLMQNKKK